MSSPFVLLQHRARAGGTRRARPRRALLGFGALAVLLEAAGIWLRAGRLGGRVVVRCRQGHLFTTIWIPGASVKSLRLVCWRFQRCPVGAHWSVVTPVRESELSRRERRAARERADAPVP